MLMSQIVAYAAALFALAGGGIFSAAMARLGLAARSMERPLASRLLLIGAPLLAVGTLLRAIRYALQWNGGVDEYVGLTLEVAAFALAWAGVESLALETSEGPTAPTWRGSGVLAVTGALSVVLILTLPTPRVVTNGLLAIILGLAAAFLAAAGWRVRRSATGSALGGFAVAAAEFLVIAIWIRQLLTYASATDPTLLDTGRAFQAGCVLVAALVAGPSLGLLARWVRGDEPAFRPRQNARQAGEALSGDEPARAEAEGRWSEEGGAPGSGDRTEAAVPEGGASAE